MSHFCDIRVIPTLFLLLLLVYVNSVPGIPTDATPSSSIHSSTPPSTSCSCPEDSPVSNFPSWSNALGIGHMRTTMVHGIPCLCNEAMQGLPLRDDYKYTAGIGYHKLHNRALNWNEARKVCNEEGGHLAIVNSVAEAHALMDLFNRSGPVKGAEYKNEALLGIHDMYKEGEWVTVLGESLAKTGYTKWSDKWGGQPDNGGGLQNCGALLAEGGLDDVSCNVAFAFFCELHAIQMCH